MENMLQRSLLAAFLVGMLIGGFALARNIDFCTVHASADVSGIISSDTIWTKANSPYNLTGNVLVDGGVTVTVEADAVVNLNSYYIRVNGTMFIQPGVTINMKTMDAGIQVNGILNVRGTSENPIHINGAVGYIVWIAPPSYSVISFSASSTGWNEQTGSGCIIEHAVINSTTISMENSLKLSNNVIDTGIYANGGSPTISYNLIKSGLSIGGGSPLISSNRFEGGFVTFYGQNGGENARIVGNTISGARSAGIWFSGSWGSGGNVLIEKNLITNNFQGIWIFSPNYEDLKSALTIQDNTIINNQQGITVQNRYSPTKISNNNIYDNQINFKLTDKASLDINVANNWWGTTDTQAISQSIIDFEDDFDLGTVTYVPFLTEPNPEAPNETSVPISTPPPTDSPPSDSPSTSPPPSQEPQQTDQTQTIVGAAIVVAVIVAGLGLLIYLTKRK